jgi:hypothetical protein
MALMPSEAAMHDAADRRPATSAILGDVGDRLFQGDWSRDLHGLTDDGVRDRLALARERERSSLTKGIGRNSKAARLWRDRARLAEAESERRGLAT